MMQRLGTAALFLLLVLVLVQTAFAAPLLQGGTGITEWISQGVEDTPSNGDSSEAQVSADGQHVVFSSSATNLVADDSNEQRDIFLYQQATDTMLRVSVAHDGTQATGISEKPFVSADGRYVAFTSDDNDLTPNDGNPGKDGFVRDVLSDTTTLVTIASDGTPGNGDITITDLSADGRFVVFESGTGSLVPNDKNLLQDVFVHDRTTGETSRVSINSDGSELNDPTSSGVISADGNRAVFLLYRGNRAHEMMFASNIVLHERDTGTTRYLALGMNGQAPNGLVWDLSISDDGRFIAFTSGASNLIEGDTNEQIDVFRYELATDRIERISVRADGSQLYSDAYSPDLSADGRYGSFITTDPATSDGGIPDSYNLYRKDMETGGVLWLTTGVLNPPTGGVNLADTHLNGDGTVAVFSTWDRYDNGDTAHLDVYLRSAITPPPPTPTRTPAPYSLYLPASVARSGIATYPRIANLTTNANGNSFAPVADANGDVVAFLSDASNLVPDDTNSVTDAFVWRAATGEIRRVSLSMDGTQATLPITDIKLSEDGRYVLLMTAAPLAPGDTNGLPDLYRHDLMAEVTEWVSVGMNGAAPDGVVSGADFSADGRWVVFSSQARNITDTPLPAECPEADCETLYRRDMTTGVTETLFKDENGIALAPLRAPSLSGDGQTLVFEQIKQIGETQMCGQYGIPVYGPYLYRVNLTTDIPGFTLIIASYHDELGRATDRCAMGYVIEDIYAEPEVARYSDEILFQSSNYNATQYYSHRRYGADIYENGTSVYIYSIGYGYSYRDPSPVLGTPPDGATTTLSGDGRVVAFAAGDLRSYDQQVATPEFPEDTNGVNDIYLLNRESNHYQRITITATGELSNGGSRDPALSANGRVLLFASEATNRFVFAGPHHRGGAAHFRP